MTAVLFKNWINLWGAILIERFVTFMDYSPFSLLLLFLKLSDSQAPGLPIPLLRLGPIFGLLRGALCGDLVELFLPQPKLPIEIGRAHV